jgi:hypothetical protein
MAVDLHTTTFQLINTTNLVSIITEIFTNLTANKNKLVSFATKAYERNGDIAWLSLTTRFSDVTKV